MTTWLAVVGWALAIALGVGWWRERQERQRAGVLLQDEQRWISELFDRLNIAHWRRNLDTQTL
ncbi:hypothetical protein [Tepidimonas sp.]|uniref:hypothetical protein n=1 Tax=Tepidimonas sp. TaxID=2002775 RepID=UPI0039188184